MFGISNHLSHRPEFVDTVQCIGKLGLWRTNLCKMVIVIANVRSYISELTSPLTQ